MFRGAVFATSLLMLIVWVCYLLRRRWEEKEKEFCVYLSLLTCALCGTLALTTIMSRIKYDFSSDGRFSMPIAYGWLVLAAVALGKSQDRSGLRSAAFASLLVPIVFSTCFFAATGSLKTPYLRLPKSKLVWSESSDPSHVAFFSQLATERRPCRGNGRQVYGRVWGTGFLYVCCDRDDAHVYYSSADLKVLAIVLPEEQPILLKKFAGLRESNRSSPRRVSRLSSLNSGSVLENRER